MSRPTLSEVRPKSNAPAWADPRPPDYLFLVKNENAAKDNTDLTEDHEDFTSAYQHFSRELKGTEKPIEDILVYWLTRRQYELFIPSPRPDLRLEQQINTVEYLKIITKRFPSYKRDDLALKLALLLFDLPVEPMVLPLQRLVQNMEMREPEPDMYNVPPPLHFLSAYKFRSYGREELKGTEDPIYPMRVYQDLPKVAQPVLPPDEADEVMLSLRGGGEDDDQEEEEGGEDEGSNKENEDEEDVGDRYYDGGDDDDDEVGTEIGEMSALLEAASQAEPERTSTGPLSAPGIRKTPNDPRVQESLRSLSWLTQPSIFEQTGMNERHNRFPINAPPLEPVLRTSNSVPMMTKGILTVTEQKRLQKTAWGLRNMLLQRAIECQYPGCEFSCRGDEKDLLHQHIRDTHQAQSCLWCDTPLYEWWTDEQRQGHLRERHFSELVRVLGGADATVKLREGSRIVSIPLNSAEGRDASEALNLFGDAEEERAASVSPKKTKAPRRKRVSFMVGDVTPGAAAGEDITEPTSPDVHISDDASGDDHEEDQPGRKRRRRRRVKNSDGEWVYESDSSEELEKDELSMTEADAEDVRQKTLEDANRKRLKAMDGSYRPSGEAEEEDEVVPEHGVEDSTPGSTAKKRKRDKTKSPGAKGTPSPSTRKAATTTPPKKKPTTPAKKQTPKATPATKRATKAKPTAKKPPSTPSVTITPPSPTTEATGGGPSEKPMPPSPTPARAPAKTPKGGAAAAAGRKRKAQPVIDTPKRVTRSQTRGQQEKPSK